MRKGIIAILCWAVCHALALAQTSTTHTDWYVNYSGGEPTRQQHVGARQAGDLNLQYNWVGYNIARYMMYGWLEMYKTTKDTTWLNSFRTAANRLFTQTTPQLFRDVGGCAVPVTGDSTGANGHADGFLGWGNLEGKCTKRALSKQIEKNVWYHCRMRVVDSAGTHRIRYWLDSLLQYDESYDTARAIGAFRRGTAALLSGWSHTKFRHVIVRSGAGGNWGTFYNLDSSLTTYYEDWDSVAVNGSLGYTGIWELNGNHEIECNASDTNPPGYPPEPDWPGRGQYAASILTRAGADTLKDTEIEYDMLIEKRNWTLAESGAALRYFIPPGDTANAEIRTVVARQGDVAPSGGGGFYYIAPGSGTEGNLTTAFGYVHSNARYIVGKLMPENQLQVAVHGRWVTGRDSLRNPIAWAESWWVAPWEENAENNPRENGFYDEWSTSDGEFGGALGKFAEIVFSDSLLQAKYGNDALGYLTTFEDNLSAKWHGVWDRDETDPDFPLGDGRYYLGFGGWKKSLFWSGWLGRLGAMFGPFSRLIQGGKWTTSQLGTFYQDNYIQMAREMPAHASVLGDGGLAWNDYRGFIGAFVSGYSDLGHSGGLVRMLVDAHEDQATTGITLADVQGLAKIVTNRLWNQVTGDSCRIWTWINGSTTVLGNGSSGMFDGWPNLAKYDFRVWEIFDEFGNGSYKIGSTKYDHLGIMNSAYNIHEADMIFAVRYGIPRRLRLDTLRTCGDTSTVRGYILRWDAPSDYPIGLGGRPGTRLQYYNVYRRSRPAGGGNWNNWQQVARIDINDRPDSGTVGFQSDHAYPFWPIPATGTDSLYAYVIRTQDWSSGILNESFDSDTVAFQNTGTMETVHLLERQPGRIDVNPQAIFIRGDTTLASGLYYISNNLQIDSGVELKIAPNAVLMFAQGAELRNSGILTAIDTVDEDCWTTFQGEADSAGAWMGIAMNPGSTYRLRHCIVRNGNNNILVYDGGESALIGCDIYGAKEHGVIYLGGSSQQDSGNVIHDNGGWNILVSGIDTHPVISGDLIYGSKTSDGIGIVDDAFPTIDHCTIGQNARHGIAIWHTGKVYPDNRPYVFYGFIYQNGWSGFGDGIQLLDARAVVRHSATSQNNNSGISINSQSDVEGFTGGTESGSNSLDRNAYNLFLDEQSTCLLGRFEPPDNSYAHLNCFSTPSVSHLTVQNASLAICEADKFEPDSTQWFSVDASSDSSTYPRGSCGSGPVAPRHDYPTAVNLSCFPQEMRKIAGTTSPIGIFRRLMNKETMGIRQSILHRLESQDAAERAVGLTLARVLTENMKDDTLPGDIRASRREGKISAVTWNRFLASRRAHKGMYSSALTALAVWDSSASERERRFIRIEKAWLSTILHGNGEAEAERLLAEAGSDPLARQAAEFLPWIAQRNDVPDTLIKEAPKPEEAAPAEYALMNYPNPFNGSTAIVFTLPREEHVRLTMHDMLGRVAAIPVDEVRARGTHAVRFDASPYPSGMYVIRMAAGDKVLTRRMHLVK